MAELVEEVERAAQTSARVLITGETGVGKELIAGQIHQRSPRRHRPFVAVNCAGLSETLLESELFGHVRGSFTGAYRDKPGKFELANSGSLFLDEVGEMSPRMQGLLLRVLETGDVQKVGADRDCGRVDTRIFAATNRDLARLVENGSFRQDLYYRLLVLHLRVPPLRERGGDIRELADYFVARWEREYGQRRKLAPETYAALEAYAWPGNIRQLENAILRTLIRSTGELILPRELPGEIMRDNLAPPVVASAEHRGSVVDQLYEQMRRGGNFWTAVYQPYKRHDLTRDDLREIVRRGLVQTHGHYVGLAQLFNLERSEYRKLLAFLRAQQCLIDYRQFRYASQAGPQHC
jgi:transcriptional regulator with GAF, ATPase, and Fis domain